MDISYFRHEYTCRLFCVYLDVRNQCLIGNLDCVFWDHKGNLNVGVTWVLTTDEGMSLWDNEANYWPSCKHSGIEFNKHLFGDRVAEIIFFLFFIKSIISLLEFSCVQHWIVTWHLADRCIKLSCQMTESFQRDGKNCVVFIRSELTFAHFTRSDVSTLSSLLSLKYSTICMQPSSKPG